MWQRFRQWLRDLVWEQAPPKGILVNLEDERLRRRLADYIERRRLGE